jgi:hypothetical protein
MAFMRGLPEPDEAGGRHIYRIKICWTDHPKGEEDYRDRENEVKGVPVIYPPTEEGRDMAGLRSSFHKGGVG